MAFKHAVYRRLPAPVRRRIDRRHRPYPFVQQYLGGLSGVEIGGSAHNRFDVDAINVDRTAEPHISYVEEQQRLGGAVLPVDVVAEGNDLPFADDSYDFVLASHVIEHFPDPIGALLEWHRVARRYVFLVVPHRDRTFDRDRPLTSVDELVARHEQGFTSDEDKHWSVWTCESFVALCERIGLPVVDTEDPDTKVGNGFAVVLAADGPPPTPLP